MDTLSRINSGDNNIIKAPQKMVSFSCLFPSAYNLQNYDNSNWVKNDNSSENFGFKILLVDDQSFNIDALVVILKYSVGVDSKKYCDRALSGE